MICGTPLVVSCYTRKILQIPKTFNYFSIHFGVVLVVFAKFKNNFKLLVQEVGNNWKWVQLMQSELLFILCKELILTVYGNFDEFYINGIPTSTAGSENNGDLKILQ